MNRIGPNQLRAFVLAEGANRGLDMTVTGDIHGFPPEICVDGKCILRADTHTQVKTLLVQWLAGYDFAVKRVDRQPQKS